MPKIEVDEAEFNRMQALTAVASKIVANPAARKRLEEAHKMVDPNASTPTLDAERSQAEPLQAMQKKFDEELAALKKEREDEKREAVLASLAAKQDAAFARLKAQRYTDEGIAEVRKIMETKGLVDVDDAVAIFERAHPPQVPSTPSGMTGTAWNFADHSADGDKDIAALLANKGDGPAAEAAVMRMANATLSELRGGR